MMLGIVAPMVLEPDLCPHHPEPETVMTDSNLTPLTPVHHDPDAPGMVFLKCAFAGPPVGGAMLSVLVVVAGLFTAVKNGTFEPLAVAALAPLLLIPGAYVFGIVPGLVAGVVMSVVVRLTRDRLGFMAASVPATLLGSCVAASLGAGRFEWPWEGGVIPLVSVASGLVVAGRIVRLTSSVTMDRTRDARPMASDRDP